MSRLIKEYTFGENNSSYAFEEVKKLLLSDGFKEKDYEYEQVFTKGKGVFKDPLLVKISIVQEKLHIEAWSFMLSLNTVFVGETYKCSSLKKLMAQIQQSLSLLGATEVLPDTEIKPLPKQYPDIPSSTTKKQFNKNHLSDSLKSNYKTLSILLYVLSIILVLVCMLSENLFLLVCSLIFEMFLAGSVAIMSATKNTFFAIVSGLLGIVEGMFYYAASCVTWSRIMFISDIYDNVKIPITAHASVIIILLISTLLIMTGIGIFILVKKAKKHYTNIINK